MGFEIFAGVVLAGLIAGIISAYICTRKEVIPNKVSALLCPFYRMAILWYRRKNSKSGLLMRGRESQKEQVLVRQFLSLDPTVSGQQQLVWFRMEQMAKCLICIFAGAILSLLVTVAGRQGSVIHDDGSIQKNEYGQGSIQADLIAASEDMQEERALVIEERAYTNAETEALFRQIQTQIEALIAGQNESLSHVTEALKLPRSVEGYPFDIVWESNAYDLVDPDGTVHNDELTEPAAVTLTATLKYRKEQFYLTENVILYPPNYSAEEQFSHDVSKALEKEQEESAESNRFNLPQQLPDGTVLHWKEAEERNGQVIFTLTIIAAVIVCVMHEREVGNRVKEREKELIMDYSELIGKLTLYMGAGMTIRNVFMRLSEEYSRKKETKKQYLYEEIMLTCHELQMGISETDAYEHFGRRCRLRQYVRLTALLTQNLKKGSSNLAQMLHRESRDAFEARKSMARKLGEEAGTKLLGPMIMMLCVVMVIIMIPAYLSFGM